ncbi:hypothetical protein MKX03_033856 [Papaver bracteatum]|nr:hypothetical protein MKX03_033856 [Papaver bracteatum]
MENNKVFMFLLISSLTVSTVVECFGAGKANDPLGKIMKSQLASSKSGLAEGYATKSTAEYSPVYMGTQNGLKEGYVTVDAGHGRSLFYYFVESPQNSSTNPLVLWLNGGPGCSSFGNGAMMELGPFRVDSNGETLSLNEYAWKYGTMVTANVIFLESPAGVGFSYSNTTSDYNLSGDTRTAEDSYTFLVNWFERFPEYKARDFYLAGESYAGHYVPQLAQLILQNNKITNQTVINLQGIAIGNAWVDFETGVKGMYDFFWTHANQGIQQNCNFSTPNTVTEKCEDYLDEADDLVEDIFIFDIYAPLCFSSSTTPPVHTGTLIYLSITLISLFLLEHIATFDPCSDNYISNYLNIAQVQKALHANNGDMVEELYHDSPLTVLPVIKELMNSGISVRMYSGDTDGRVPVTSTRYPINKLTTSVKTKWYPWYNKEQFGGYAIEYENLTFVTIRGAGHFVPSYQPARVQGYGSSGHDPLGKILNRQLSSFKSSELVVETTKLSSEYSPVYMSPQEGLKEADKIDSLPGQPEQGVDFDQYSGYVMVDGGKGRALFYYFVESPRNSSTNPLVLWLNGGPGCSSFGNGAMMELGSFRVKRDRMTLDLNEYSWNNAANVIFLESPAGVGFSYSNTTSDYNLSGDERTRFPEYKTRDFFLAGESYAGNYVPQLAQLILHNNKITNQTIINLKGIAIGNAYVDFETNYTGMYDFFWTHSLISDEANQGIGLYCNFASPYTITEKCKDFLGQADIGDIFIYDIYAPLCPSSPSSAPPAGIFDPCSVQYIDYYLNIPEVQKALHANVTGLPYQWESCSPEILTLWNDGPLTVLPVIEKLMTSGIAVGDTDGRVPVTSSRYSINNIAASVKTKWYPWYSQKQVGGYAVEYENLTFVTIRGAGHFVPSYQPARALTFFKSFLQGKLPPSSF